MQPRQDYYKTIPALSKAIHDLSAAVQNCGIEKRLLHLIKLRASQINGCSYCVDLHTREARNDGDTEQRLYLISAWHESPLFTDRERAALAWTEALTLIAQAGVSDELYAQTRTQFSEQEIGQLTVAVSVINVWNRMAISSRMIHRVE